MRPVVAPAVERILLVSYFSPSRGHAGGLRLLELYQELRRLRPRLHLCLLTCAHPESDWGEPPLGEVFDEVHRRPVREFSSSVFLATGLAGHSFDLVDFQFHQSGALMSHARRLWPQAVLLFSPMESQLRACLLELDGASKLSWRSARQMLGLLRSAAQEWLYLRRAHRIQAVSSADQQVLSRFTPASRQVFCVPTGIDTASLGPSTAIAMPSASTAAVCFAYWGSKTNQEALVWFCRQVHRRIRDAVSGYRLRVVGRGLTPELVAACDVDGIDFVGPVATLSDALQGTALGIAPALSGAGVRGKIHQYAAFGIPCVASPLGVAGLRYEAGVSVLLAADAESFATACIELLTNSTRRSQIAAKAREVCFTHYSWNSQSANIFAVYGLPPEKGA